MYWIINTKTKDVRLHTDRYGKLSKKARRKWLHSTSSEYKKIAVVFLPSFSEILERNETRKGKYINSQTYENMMKSFYPPLYDEFDEIQWIC